MLACGIHSGGFCPCPSGRWGEGHCTKLGGFPLHVLKNKPPLGFKQPPTHRSCNKETLDPIPGAGVPKPALDDPVGGCRAVVDGVDRGVE